MDCCDVSTTYSTGEKQRVNKHNLRFDESGSVCICGDFVALRPIILSCGHKYHFKCARIHVFNIPPPEKRHRQHEEEGEEQLEESTATASNSNSMDDSYACPLCDLNTSNSSANRSAASNSSQSSETTKAEAARTTTTTTIKANYEYLTPDVSIKYPKNSRYESNRVPQKITHISNQSNSSFLPPQTGVPLQHETSRKTAIRSSEICSPSSSSFRLSPAISYLPQYSNNSSHTRAPLADITPTKPQHSPSTPSPMNDIFSQQHYLMQYQARNSFLDGVVKVLGFNLISQVTSAPVTEASQMNEERLHNQNNNSLIPASEFSDLDINSQQLSLSFQSSSMNREASFRSFLKSNHNNESYFRFDKSQSLSFSSCSSEISNYRLSHSTSLKQSWCEYSINESQVSCGSNKENTRNLVTRRARHNGIVVSFFEGTSFLSDSSLLCNVRSKCEIQFPFVIEVAIEQPQAPQQPESQDTQEIPQDILLVIESSAMFNDVKQRYELVKQIFSRVNENDRIRLAWMDFDGNVIFNGQSDFFVGREMSEILAKEFMRLQARKESKFPIGLTLSSQDAKNACWVESFIQKQFTGLRKNCSIQHVVFIIPIEQSSRVPMNGSSINDVYVSTIIGIRNESGGSGNAKEIKEGFVEQEDVTISQKIDVKSIGDECGKRIANARKIRVKRVELNLQFNRSMNNLKRVQLLNKVSGQAQVIRLARDSSNRMTDSISSHSMDIEDDLMDFKVTLGNLRAGDVVRLMFEGIFSLQENPIYRNARLFNCDVSYFMWRDSRERHNSLDDSMNSTIDAIGGIGSNETSIAPGNESNGRAGEEGVARREIVHAWQLVKSAITRLYMLIEWRQQLYGSQLEEEKNKLKQGSLAKYDRRVMKSLWEIERDYSGIEEAVYEKFFRIFEAIAARKGSLSFPEFDDFHTYYTALTQNKYLRH